MEYFGTSAKNYGDTARGGGMTLNINEDITLPNQTREGKSKTIKANYYKTGVSNLCEHESVFQATGVAELVSAPIQVGAMPRPNGELSKSQGFRIYSVNSKSVTLKGNAGGSGGKTGLYAIPIEYANDKPIKAVCLTDGKEYTVYEVSNGTIQIKNRSYPIKLEDGFYIIRKLTVKECMRLQTVPEWFDFGVVSNAQAYKMLGNGWTCDVISHLIEATQATL